MYILVTKTSQLDIRRDSIEQLRDKGLLCEDQFARMQVAHEEHMRTHHALVSALNSHKISFKEVKRGEEWPDLSGVKGVITVGGDGTVLEASHFLQDSDVPLIGVRSSQMSVGFLCYVTESEVEELALELSAGSLQYLNVSRIKAVITRLDGSSEKTPPVLNDFLYTNINPAETTRYVWGFDSVSESHKSSGVWVSTAAGSTAAISAAGGKVYPIESNKFQYVIREPYCPPGGCYITTKGEFSPEDNLLTIDNRCEKAVLAMDGHHGSVELQMGDIVRFERASDLRIARKSIT